jgi:hypothetical protein
MHSPSYSPSHFDQYFPQASEIVSSLFRVCGYPYPLGHLVNENCPPGWPVGSFVEERVCYEAPWPWYISDPGVVSSSPVSR